MMNTAATQCTGIRDRSAAQVHPGSWFNASSVVYHRFHVPRVLQELLATTRIVTERCSTLDGTDNEARMWVMPDTIGCFGAQ